MPICPVCAKEALETPRRHFITLESQLEFSVTIAGGYQALQQLQQHYQGKHVSTSQENERKCRTIILKATWNARSFTCPCGTFFERRCADGKSQEGQGQGQAQAPTLRRSRRPMGGRSRARCCGLGHGTWVDER